jgi:sugar phosphate isomerase/epimerase
MKLAVSTYSLARWRRESGKTLEEALDWIAGNGVEAVEFAGLDDRGAAAPLKRAAEVREYCRQQGLAPAGYCTGAELLCSPEQQREVIDTIKQHMDVAAELGVKSMRHDVTRGFREDWEGPRTFEAALEVIAPAIREVADYAQAKGVKSTLENHGFYMQAPERVERLIQLVNHPNYGLTMDMGNFLCVNEDPVRAVQRLARYVVMAHAKDFHVRPKQTMPAKGWFATPTEIALRGAIAGHGAIDIPAQLRILKDSGYSGYLSLEFEGMEEPTMAVRMGLEYLREELKKIDALE